MPTKIENKEWDEMVENKIFVFDNLVQPEHIKQLSGIITAPGWSYGQCGNSNHKEYEILNNVIDRSEQIANGLKNINGMEGVRNSGLIMAFDIKGEENFKNFVKKSKSCGMIFNSSGNKTARLRPNLNLSEQEANEALNIIELSLKS